MMSLIKSALWSLIRNPVNLFRSACANDLVKSIFLIRNRSLKVQFCIDFDAYCHYVDEMYFRSLEKRGKMRSVMCNVSMYLSCDRIVFIFNFLVLRFCV